MGILDVMFIIYTYFHTNENAISSAKEVRRNLREGINLANNRWSRHLADRIH